MNKDGGLEGKMAGMMREGGEDAGKERRAIGLRIDDMRVFSQRNRVRT